MPTGQAAHWLRQRRVLVDPFGAEVSELRDHEAERAADVGFGRTRGKMVEQ